jgi:hypothetical protein
VDLDKVTDTQGSKDPTRKNSFLGHLDLKWRLILA